MLQAPGTTAENNRWWKSPFLKRAGDLGTAVFPGLIKRWENQPCCPSTHHKHPLPLPSLRRREGGGEMGDCQRETAEYPA